MRRTEIPHYRADARASYILPTDGSLDRERYEREVADILAAGGKLREHPLSRYWEAKHRFDLDAVDYLDGKPVRISEYFNREEPEVFELRRLNWAEFDEVKPPPLFDAEDPEALRRWKELSDSRALRACRLGLTGVRGSVLADKLKRSGGELTFESMQLLHDIDPKLPITLGHAVIAYSGPLTEAEGKRSGS